MFHTMFSKKANKLLSILFLFSCFSLVFSASPIPTETFIIMDFEDSVIHDETWLASQAEGFTGFHVTDKNDSGSNNLSIAIGEGRAGSNALLVESLDTNAGLPSFFLIKAQSKNGQAARLTDENGYMLPRNLRANRLEFWLKFDSGFRQNLTSSSNIGYPNHQNFHLGTYHFDPAKINGGSNDGVVESDGWHFYHQVYLRHDKADDGWIHVVLNQQPQHLRTFSKSTPPNNPTMPAGNYFELLTRLYMDLVPYFSDPEISYPIRMWVDDIVLSYVPETPDITIDFVGHNQGDIVKIEKDKETFFSFTVTNNLAKNLSGTLSTNTYEKFNPKLAGGSFFKTITLSPYETQTMNFSVTPNINLALGFRVHSGLSFINDDEIFSNSTSINRSLSDNNIEKRWQTKTGPHDAVVSSNFIRLEIAASISNLIPVAHAGINQSIVDTDGNDNESVTLNGSASNDPDGTITSYVWKKGATQIATGETAIVTLPVGSHTITLTVTDNDGDISTDTISILITKLKSNIAPVAVQV